MTDPTFTQYLIIFLILLVGGKEFLMAFMRKRGWVNGNGNGKDIKQMREEVLSLKENHFHSLDAKMDKLIDISKDNMADRRLNQQKMIDLLGDIKDKLK